MRSLMTIALACLTISGCAKAPVSRGETNNAAMQVDLLFEKDGYAVHRFEDAGRFIYYVTPQGQAVSVYSQNCGKGCVREERTQSSTQGNMR